MRINRPEQRLNTRRGGRGGRGETGILIDFQPRHEISEISRSSWLFKLYQSRNTALSNGVYSAETRNRKQRNDGGPKRR